ncbi:phospholipase/carboxylesterase [Halosimplex carlsbadense 2-9-1]|uniref:Phospholipase/carboxylesterase n=1 Tax=Halosimplex carlsbadense 2-9-1 TaxID=797114 RepID=M0CJZ0_9EURY|nr:alpha/beta fold hydrolase [Halosimplex carlsbadense]ELZ23595.1 phospholipase/carboxylesterase [Halosimplex carlsbadense 2-9-1]
MDSPHQDQPLITAGAPLSVAEAAVVLVHGRGGSADGMVALADEFYRHGLALVAPSARRNRWYQNSFLAPREANEPDLSSALAAVADAVETVREAGVPRDRVVVLGISQGACLVAEFAAGTPRRYGGVVLSSGGLMGPEVGDYDGCLDGTPVLVGGHEDDQAVPIARVRETATVFESLGGDVRARIEPGDDHGITDAELAAVAELVEGLLTDADGERSGR